MDRHSIYVFCGDTLSRLGIYRGTRLRSVRIFGTAFILIYHIDAVCAGSLLLALYRCGTLRRRLQKKALGRLKTSLGIPFKLRYMRTRGTYTMPVIRSSLSNLLGNTP